MISITKIFKFDAAHYLPNYDGCCKNLHGHSFRLEIEIIGSIQKEGSKQGMIYDFSDLKNLVNEHIIDKMDHKLLNDIFPNPTAENMLEYITTYLMGVMDNNLILTRVRLWETDTSYAEWKNKNI